MTLTLKPITEARLLALAAQRGQTPEALLDAVQRRLCSLNGQRRTKPTPRKSLPGVSRKAMSFWKACESTQYHSGVWMFPGLGRSHSLGESFSDS